MEQEIISLEQRGAVDSICGPQASGRLSPGSE
jgi:hypothetical protein